MEGNNTSSGGSTTNRDRTFIGNGCPNEWRNDPPLYGGSVNACETRILQTLDGEDQKTGTYYSFMAATSGSGGTALTKDNTNTPDTFCPLGWQLPYGGTGGDYYNKSKSMVYLQSNEVYGTPFIVGKYPLSEIYGGYINFETGALFVKTITGDYHTKTSRSDSTAYRVRMGSTGVITTLDSSVGKNIGSNIRCVSELAT